MYLTPVKLNIVTFFQGAINISRSKDMKLKIEYRTPKLPLTTSYIPFDYDFFPALFL